MMYKKVTLKHLKEELEEKTREFRSPVSIHGEIIKLNSSKHDQKIAFGNIQDEQIELPVLLPAHLPCSIGDYGIFTGHLVWKQYRHRLDTYYRLDVDTFQKLGVGTTHKLQTTFSSELEFNLIEKQPFPWFKNFLSVGIVSSLASDGYEDLKTFIKNEKKIFSTFYDCDLLESKSIVDAFSKADSADHDIVIIARGGGDLQAFNQKKVIERIKNRKTYTITALGHKNDQTISDLLSDYSAITPSAAAFFLKEQINNPHFEPG